METNSDFNESSQRFVDWFQSLPGATFHNDIEIRDLRQQNAGRGIVAKADIPPDTVLFTIPRNAIICASTSALKSQLPHLFDLENDDAESCDGDEASSKSQDSWTLLILIMIYEFLQGPASRWKPYLDILPSTFDTPMFWSDTELSELQASALIHRIGKDSADQMIRSKILPIIHDHPHIFFPANSPSPKLDDTQLLALAHRMGSTIMAYAFDLEPETDDSASGLGADGEEGDGWVEDREGKTMLGMVPMADMLNADAEFNAHIAHHEDCLTATALRTIHAGEEILNYYGSLSSAELLRRYGYVTAKHARYDAVELAWELVEKRLKERVGGGMRREEWERVTQLVESLSDEDEGFEKSFVLERSSPDPDSTGRLVGEAVFDGLPDELEKQFKTFLKAVKNIKPDVEVVVRALSDRDIRKELYLECVRGALQDQEGQYQTSLEEDERLLGERQVTGRKRMAVWVRRGEKQLLREAKAWVDRELAEVRNRRPGGDDGPAAKRRRV
ncbi:SET domain-containing protein [Canariomyces notabilis]|uniref:SET domain-containing protein n=1 Tax=Canariomyces notabilis TaxID=2074819 RepID=A0AAN6T7Y6_9PEZI|nr:SET domain-containing protein [Canariomyces arenarius]